MVTPIYLDDVRDRIDEHWNSLLVGVTTVIPDPDQAVAAG